MSTQDAFLDGRPDARGSARGRAALAGAGGVLVALTAVQLAAVAAVPVLPGQDLPQHLAYARILADYADPTLPFRGAFTVAERLESYFVTHYALAALARAVGIDAAARVVYGAYVVGSTAAFATLTHALAPERPGIRALPWTALLAPLVVWSPVAWMGFLPFLLATPFVLAGLAASITAARPSRSLPRFVALGAACAAASATLHVVAALALVAIVTLAAILGPHAGRARRALSAAAVAGATAATAAAWSAGSESGDRVRATLGAVLARTKAGGLREALEGTLHIRWGTAGEKGTYALLALAGTLPPAEKVLVGSGVALLAGVALVGAARMARARDTSRTAALRAIAAFAAFAAAAPAAIQQPSDISFLDYRLVSLAAAFALASLDPSAFATRGWARGALVAHAALATTLLVRAVVLVGAEGGAVRRLVARLDAHATLLAVPLASESEHVDPGNTVGHYWAVLHTVHNGGLTSQLWDRFSPQLPVGWQPGRALPAPHDRRPWDVTAAQVRGASHVLVALPDRPSDEDDATRAVEALLARESERLACDGRFCLSRTYGGVSTPTGLYFKYESKGANRDDK